MAKHHYLLLSLLVLVAGCAHKQIISKQPVSASEQKQTLADKSATQALIKVNPESIPLLDDRDTKKSLLKALELNTRYFESLNSSNVYDFADRQVTVQELKDSNNEFKRILENSTDVDEFNDMVKERFDVYMMSGKNNEGDVVFSSYYEPTTEASLKKDDVYKYPMYARPDDLVTVNLEDFNSKFKGEKISGRVKGGNFVPYYSREDIDFNGILNGKGLELAWFKNLPDLMDIHIQGSGRLTLPNGREIKALFAATNGLKFKGWLTAMIEQGLIPKDKISHEAGKEYLEKYPEKTREVMSANARYTFFKLRNITDPEEGPIGTYGLPLTGWRSVAADISLYPLGAIALLQSDMPDVTDEGQYLGMKKDSRFVFIQDTGGAIKGTERIDFFAGHGKKARTFAFKVWNKGKLYILLLKKEFCSGGETNLEK